MAITSKIHYSAHVGKGARIADTAKVNAGACVGDNVFIDAHVTIGMNATILDDVHVEAGAIIGPGAVIAMNVGEGLVMSGNPARCTGRTNTYNPDETCFAIPPDLYAKECERENCNELVYTLKAGHQKRTVVVDLDGRPHCYTCQDANKLTLVKGI